MAKILGRSGIITIGGLAGIISAAIERISDPVENTVMGAVTKTFQAGPKSFTFNAEAISATPALAETFAGAVGMKSFDIEGSAEAIDVSAIGDLDANDLPYKSFVGGLPEWSGTIEMNPDSTTVLPVEGADYTLAGAACIVTSVGPALEVNGAMTVSIGVKGKGTLPAILDMAPGGIVGFEMSTSAGGLAAGDVVLTSFKASGSVGELIKYSLSGQGTGELGLPAEG